MASIASFLGLDKGLGAPTPAPTTAQTTTFFTPAQLKTPPNPVVSALRSTPQFFSDVSKTLFPTFDQQLQSVQDEARQSLLPDVAKTRALALDKEQRILRLPVQNPQTGKMELTGTMVDTPFLGSAERIGVKALKVGEEVLADRLKGLIGKSAKQIEGELPTLVEGHPTAIKQLATKISAASSPEEASSFIKNEISLFKTPVPESTTVKTPQGEMQIPEKPTITKPLKFEPITIERDFTKQIEKTTFSEADATDLLKRLDVLGLGTRTVRTFAEVEQSAQALGTDVGTLLKVTKSGPISDVEAKALKNTIASSNKFIANAQQQLTRDPSLAAKLEGQVKQAQQIIDVSLKKLAPGVTEIGRALSALRMQANETLDPAVWFLKAQNMLGPRTLTPEMQGIINNLIDNQDRIGLAQYVSSLRTASWAEKAATLWKAGLLTAFRTHEANILGNATMAGLESASNVVSTSFDVLASLFSGKRTITFSASSVAAKIKGLGTGIQKGATFFKNGTYSTDIMNKYEVKQVNFENKILNGYTKGVFRALGAEDIVFREAALQEALVTQAEVIAKNEGISVRNTLSSIPKELEPLAAEAQKYKSAEEFKNAMLQHATDVPEKVRATGITKGQLASNVLEDIKSENPSYFLKNKDGSVQIGKNSQPIKSVFIIPKNALSKTETVGGVTRATGELGAKPIAEVPPNFNLTDFYNKVKGGVTGQAYKERVRELLEKPTNEMIMNSIDAAEYQTFQQASKVAELLTTAKVTLQNTDSPIAKWGGILLEFIAPFSKTPINIAKAIADYSPLGFVKAILKAVPAQTRSQQAFVKDMGRAVTGTGIITLGAYLAHNGLMTGNAPTETNARDQFYAEGKQPNSLLVGPWWFKLSRISPIGNLLSIGAEFNEQGKTTEGAALASGVAFGAAKTLTDQTFLQGVSSLLNAVQDPEAYSGKYIQNAVSSLIPTIIGHTARAIDPRLRIPENTLQAIEAKLPFFSTGVPLRRDIFGNPVHTGGGALAIINPFEPTLAVNNPVINEAKDLGISIGLPDQTISGTKLSNAEYSVYQKIQGKLLEENLNNLITSEGYKLLSAPDKEKEFKNLITNVRQSVNDQVFPAIMIRRYSLPKDANPQAVRIVMSALNKSDKFKNMSIPDQAKAIRKLLQLPSN